MTTAAKKPGKAPQDHQPPAEEIATEFTMGTSKGDVTLLRFNLIPFGVKRAIRKEHPAEQIFSLLEYAADEDNLGVIDQLQDDEVHQLVERWQEDSGITMGESSAS